jgi:serine/threonine protein kinase
MQEDINDIKVLLTGEPDKRVGEQIGNYRLMRWLGRGACADVYLGEHIYLKKQSAIKLLRLDLPKQAQKDFLNEVCTIAGLEHPHIMRVLDYGVQTGTPFLVMAYAPNGSLRERIPEGTRLPLEQILPLVQQIASALDYAHEEELIHRDIKPENILLGEQDQTLLSDFGLTLVVQSMHTQATDAMIGTALYMAPEMLEGKVHFASDQYALGILIYEWLCGECPFTGSIDQIGIQHTSTPPPSLCERVPDLSPAVEHVVFKALAKDPAQRYENVTAFANALQDAWEETASISPKSSILQPSSSVLENLFAFDEISTWPGPIKPTQPLHYRKTNWQIVLLLVAIAAVLVSSARLWYIIATASASAYYTNSAAVNSHLTPIANLGTPIVASPTGTTSGETPSVSVPLLTPTPTPILTPPVSYEAESDLNTLTEGATVLKCPKCSGMEKVGYIGLDYNTHTNGTLQFNNIYKNIGDKYELTIYYLLAGIDVPTEYISVNGGPATAFNVPSTANSKVVGTLTLIVSLNAGNNTIEFSNPTADAPDIDRIIV